MPRRRGSLAFSLLEVVIATALFAGAVTVLLALLASTLGDAADAADVQTALRLPGAIEVTLRELVARDGLPALATRIPADATAADRGFLLVATRAGESVRAADSPSGGAAGADAYFLIDLRRFPAGPLGFDAGRAVLPLQARVSWPYRVRTPEGLAAPVAWAQRRSVTFNVAVGP